MRPTRLGTLWAVLAGVAVVSWSLLSLLESRGAALLPSLPWSAPAALALLAVLIALAAIGVRRRLRQLRRGGASTGAEGALPKAVNALVVARLAVLGKASAFAGAVLAGAYAGYVLLIVSDLSTERRRELGAIAGLSGLAAVLLAAAGLALERCCRVPPDAGGPGPDGPPSHLRPS